MGGAAAGGRIRDENALSFRHFLQPQSDLVPQPAPTRSRGNRGQFILIPLAHFVSPLFYSYCLPTVRFEWFD